MEKRKGQRIPRVRAESKKKKLEAEREKQRRWNLSSLENKLLWESVTHRVVRSFSHSIRLSLSLYLFYFILKRRINDVASANFCFLYDRRSRGNFFCPRFSPRTSPLVFSQPITENFHSSKTALSLAFPIFFFRCFFSFFELPVALTRDLKSIIITLHWLSFLSLFLVYLFIQHESYKLSQSRAQVFFLFPNVLYPRKIKDIALIYFLRYFWYEIFFFYFLPLLFGVFSR